MSKDTMSFDDALLSDYSEPAIETAPTETVYQLAKPEQPPVQNLPPTYPATETRSQEQANSDAEWRGNPLYYQTGKKAGQLRKTPLVNYETKEGDSVVGGDLITGAMFISMIDLFIPGLIMVINNMMVSDPASMLKMSDLQLETETLNRLKPLADSTLRRIKLRGDPLLWLIITMLSLYTFQFAKIKFERKLKEALEAKEKAKEERV